MTRFLLIARPGGRHGVRRAARGARPGETYVPRAPSATVLNIAKALIGDAAIEIEVTGIRPGEKMHEILVSEEEVHHCVRRGDYYVDPADAAGAARRRARASRTRSKREYSSGDNVLSLAATVGLLKRNRLMVEDETGRRRGAAALTPRPERGQLPCRSRS